MCIQGDPVVVGNNIKFLREKYHENQTELAKAIAVRSTTISNYELGIRSPGSDILAKIADHYRVSVNILLSENIQNAVLMNENEYLDVDQWLVFNYRVCPLIYNKTVECREYKRAIEHCKYYIDKARKGTLIFDELRYAERYLNRIKTEDINVVEAIATVKLWLFATMWSYILNEENGNYDIVFDVDKNVKVKELLQLKYELPEDINEISEDYSEDFLEQIRILKRSTDKHCRDFAEHYMGVGYLVRLLSIDLSVVDATTVGMQIIASQALAENYYSDRAITALRKLYALQTPQNVEVNM